MARFFRGGFLPEEGDGTRDVPIETMPASDFVTLPLQQHKGSALLPLVSVGERVLKGQKIADGEKDALCCPIHSPVSGTVKEIGIFPTPDGEGEAIVIENDYREELCPSVKPFDTPLSKASPEKIISFIREKGIVGLGGTAIPTWAKLKESAGKVKTLIVNCTECEPYLAADHRLVLENAEQIVGGARILMSALSCERAVFALEESQVAAASRLAKVLEEREGFSIRLFSPKYPQGDERLLIRAVTGEEIPMGKKPFDLGVAVFNGETLWAVYRAFVTGMPQISRIVTVGGACAKKEANLLVPIGVSFAQVLARSGGLSRAPGKLIAGGPMRGISQKSDAVPVTKKVGAILALEDTPLRERECIRCGRCVLTCPLRLMPLAINLAALRSNRAELKKYHTAVCSECGVCTYVCPAGIPLLQNIRKGKELLRGKEKGR